MSMEAVISMFGSIATVVAVVGGMITLNFTLRRPIDRVNSDLSDKIDRLDTKIDRVDGDLSEKIDRLDAKVDRVNGDLSEKIDRLDEKFMHELGEFRLESATLLARHDERLAAIERQGPRLQLS